MERAKGSAQLSRPYISDYLIVIGHLWYCADCRQELRRNPHAFMKGLKLTDDQKDSLLRWSTEPLSIVDRLSADSGLEPEDFQLCISHPRARLRHLGVQKRSS